MTSSLALPPISTLPTLPPSSQTAALDLLFEPSPTLHERALPCLANSTFDSYNALIDAIFTVLSELATDSTPENRKALHAILGSHPRLGAPKLDSAQSTAEQARLRAGGGEAEAAELANLNARYEDAFPGLRYVVFVNGRGRPEIMEDMRARILRGDFALEERTAIQAMCDIAKDRARKLQATSK